MKKNLLAALLTVSALVGSMPVTAFASTQTVDPAEQDSFEVVASTTVTHEDLAKLGLNVEVSFALWVRMDYN